MKDILSYSMPSSMAKVVTPKKQENKVKKRKDLKSHRKVRNDEKKFTFEKKRANKNVKNTAKRSTGKKKYVSKKNEGKKKTRQNIFKESKCGKSIKYSSVDVARKQRHSPKKQIAKNNRVYMLPKKHKIQSKHSEKNKFYSDDISTTLSQTTVNPWVLKLDVSSQPTESLVNGVVINGTIPLCKKSVIFIPKHSNTLSGQIFKKGTLETTRPPTSGINAISKKDMLKNGFDFGNMSSCSDLRNINEAKKCSRALALKTQKSSFVNRQKLSITKNVAHTLQNSKTLSKDFNKNKKSLCIKDDKSNYIRKPISISNEINKSLIVEHQMYKCPKKTKTLCVKYKKKKDKESNSQNNSSKILNDKNIGCKTLCPINQAKGHPQRMASLDAMAKMHIICSTDRHLHANMSNTSTKASSLNSQANNSRKLHMGIKNEIKNIKSHVIHSQINCVKIEESSVSKSTEDVHTFCSFSQQQEQTISKKSRGRPCLKTALELVEDGEDSFRLSEQKIIVNTSKAPKQNKRKNEVTKHTRLHRTVTVKKTLKSSPKALKVSGRKKKLKPKINEKSKVKETIRMKKMCTFQSVTTVSSNEAINSVVSSCSQLGMTTDFERKKTTVKDKTCEHKANIRIEELQEPFMPSLGHPATHVSACCNHSFYALPHAIIPVAHSQSCERHLLIEKSTQCQPHCCGRTFPVHHCTQRDPHIFNQQHQHDLGCCSYSTFQSVHDSYNHSRVSNSCAHNSNSHLNSVRYSSCSCCLNVLPPEQDQNINLASNFQSKLCACHESFPTSSSTHRKLNNSACPSTIQSCNSSLHFDQVPLDLSLGSSSFPVEKSVNQSRTFCKPHKYCQDYAILPFTHCYQYNVHSGFVPNSCISSCNRNCHCKEHFNIPHNCIILESHQTKSFPVLSTISTCSNDESPSVNLICQEIAAVHGCTTGSTTQGYSHSNHLPLVRERKFAHGWSWEGEPSEQMISLTNDSVPVSKWCYPALRHREGDIINEKDCVLLKSGPKDTDLPYVAKISAFWENPDDGEMMMSLLWYYRPEHTEQDRKPDHMDDEVFASKHRDVNSVACIEDKCYVLTFNEYNRYKTNVAVNSINGKCVTALTVPEYKSTYIRQHRLPTECVASEMIFFCRHVYDFRQKRILKNPT